VVTWVFGDRSQALCQKPGESIPQAYRSYQSSSDFGTADASVFPLEAHLQIDKQSRQLAHIERWHNPLRYRLARYDQKTLTFSKSEAMHEGVTRWFFSLTYNLSHLS